MSTMLMCEQTTVTQLHDALRNTSTTDADILSPSPHNHLVAQVEDMREGAGLVHDHGAVCGRIGEAPKKEFSDREDPGYYLYDANDSNDINSHSDMQKLKAACSRTNTLCFHHAGREGAIFEALDVQSADLRQALHFWLGASGNGQFPPGVPEFSFAVAVQDPLLNIRPLECAASKFEPSTLDRPSWRLTSTRWPDFTAAWRTPSMSSSSPWATVLHFALICAPSGRSGNRSGGASGRGRD